MPSPKTFDDPALGSLYFDASTVAGFPPCWVATSSETPELELYIAGDASGPDPRSLARARQLAEQVAHILAQGIARIAPEVTTAPPPVEITLDFIDACVSPPVAYFHVDEPSGGLVYLEWTFPVGPGGTLGEGTRGFW